MHHSQKNVIPISHLPTFLLILGYPIFWLELLCFDTARGVTSPWAAILFVVFSMYVLIRNSKSKSSSCDVPYLKQEGGGRYFIIIGVIVMLFILLVSLRASLLPPHMVQEHDTLNYHYTLPRQHLINNSFFHLSWSTADLFPLPIQCGLSPFWFATWLPNKFPQFLFLLGLMAVSVRILHLWQKNVLHSSMLVFAILGSHGIGIQMGTAMLDIVICYLFLAFIDSLLRGSIVLAAIECSFFFWAKSFLPFQMIFITVCLMVIYKLFKFRKYNIAWGEHGGDIEKFFNKKNMKRFIILLLVFSVFVGGPFVIKSLYYSGTPLYPFFTGKMIANSRIDQTSNAWQSLLRSAQAHVGAKDQYGYGRHVIDFIRHFWLVAVPDEGVNNKFDYPVGLPYLIFVVPFLRKTISIIREKRFSISAFFIIIYWATWWLGSQQSRFLYIPLVLMFISAIAIIEKPSRILMAALLIAMGLNGISVFRAHQHDLKLGRIDALRPHDKEMFELSRKYLSQKRRDVVSLDNHEVAYAQFPVRINKEKLPFVILSE